MDNYVYSGDFPEQIQKRIDAGMKCGSSVGRGWLSILTELDLHLANIDPDYVIDQVKEKFGGLRYYISWSKEIDDENMKKYEQVMELAEQLAAHTCEVCGQEGKIQPGRTGWYACRCEEHKD